MGQPRIGIDLGGTKIEGVILDDLGNIVFRQRVRTPKNDFSATTDAIAHLVQILDREIETKGLPARRRY